MVPSVAVLLLAAAACVASEPERTPPEATVSSGRLSGKWLESRHGRDIAAFEGIPYAAAPVGELRFQPPQPAKPWSSVRQATQPGPVCTQRNLYFGQKEVVGEEDCLFLNVYTPEDVADESPLDVMVFIHGGGWISGSGDLYEPDYFLDHDVILVTFNYRLGPLGFLSTLDDVFPGNNGMKDQVQALRWVQENIAAFGGNPKSVTIFGESAGGASSHLLTLSPLAKGLFHRAIPQSGNALTTWAFAPPGEAKRHAARLAEFIKCPVSPSEDFKKCLLAKSNVEITSVDLAFLEWQLHPMIPFKPVQERSGPGAFIDRHPRDIIVSGESNDIPLMLGFTSHEGCICALGLYENHTALQEFNDRFDYLMPIMLLIRDQPQPLLEDALKKLRKFYYGEGAIAKDAVDNTINMFTDAYFSFPTIQAIQLHAKHGKSPIYLYEFAHLSRRSFATLFGAKSPDYGVCHADDLIHLFPLATLFPGVEPTVDDVATSEKFVEFFVNFAKTGRPSKDSSWQRVSHPEEAEYMHIGSPGDVIMRANYAPQRMKLWAELPVRIGRMPSVHDEL